MKNTSIGFNNKKYHSGAKAPKKKIKMIFNNLDDEFMSIDVKKELDKYRGLTETPKGTVARYIREMKKLGWIEVSGYVKTGKKNRKSKYKKIAEARNDQR